MPKRRHTPYPTDAEDQPQIIVTPLGTHPRFNAYQVRNATAGALVTYAASGVPARRFETVEALAAWWGAMLAGAGDDVLELEPED